MLTRRRFAGLVAASALTSLASSDLAQAWPTRHVRLIVPFVPGGAADVIARVMANRLAEAWGQQVVVENRGGAGSNIGAQAAAQSDPDGYTLYITSVPHATNRFLYASLNYDPVADFAPITLICTQSNIMVVPNSSPAKWCSSSSRTPKPMRERPATVPAGSAPPCTSPASCSSAWPASR